MSGSQLKERVLIPLGVIVGTVAALALLGTQLLGISGASDEAEPIASVTPTEVAPTDVIPSATPEPLPSESIDPATVERLPVIVLNGTEKVGYAKKVGDNLNFEDWVIQEIGNWTGPALTENTVYYPVGGAAAAQLLAQSENVKGVAVAADATLNQTALTLVLAR
jgi:hypothetical protein